MVGQIEEQSCVAQQPAVPHEQIIGKHTDAAAPEFLERDYFKFNLRAGHRRKNLSQYFQRHMMAPLIEMPVAAQADVEFQVIVRPLAFACPHDSAFSASV